MIAVIDYGMGNIGSIINMLKKIGAEACSTQDEKIILNADKIILPGVGSFDNGMKHLRELGIDKLIINQAVEKKIPTLGICLGMQLLGRASEEGQEKGLEIIPFECKKFSFSDNNLKVPHMGWDIARVCQKEDALVKGLEENQRYYFVHSYYAVCDSTENILMDCEYGNIFSAAVKKENIYGVQFHPEKSHKFGMSLLENFVGRV